MLAFPGDRHTRQALLPSEPLPGPALLRLIPDDALLLSGPQSQRHDLRRPSLVAQSAAATLSPSVTALILYAEAGELSLQPKPCLLPSL